MENALWSLTEQRIYLLRKALESIVVRRSPTLMRVQARQALELDEMLAAMEVANAQERSVGRASRDASESRDAS